MFFGLLAAVLHRPWQGFSWEAFNHWGLYLKVVVPSILMVALDWWLYDVATFLAGKKARTHAAWPVCS